MSHLKKYVEYIKNTGGVSRAGFDDDWEPIGPRVRDDLIRAGYIDYSIAEDLIILTEAGKKLAGE